MSFLRDLDAEKKLRSKLGTLQIKIFEMRSKVQESQTRAIKKV